MLEREAKGKAIEINLTKKFCIKSPLTNCFMACVGLTASELHKLIAKRCYRYLEGGLKLEIACEGK